MNESEIRGLHEAYLKIYEDTTYEDLLEFCLIEELFDTIEESEYFVEELIHNDLVEQFVVDTLEYYGYDENEIALCEGKGKLAADILRGLSALSRSARTKAGIRTAISKSGQVVTPEQAPMAIRSARSAAKASMPAPEKAGKYLDMLKSTRDKQGKLFNPEGKPYNFKSKAGQEWKGERATDPVPVRPGRRGSGTPSSSTSSRTSPGQMGIDFTPRSSTSPGKEVTNFTKKYGGGLIGTRNLPTGSRAPKPSWVKGELPSLKPAQVSSTQTAPKPSQSSKKSTYTPPDAGLPIRATGPGGSPRTQRLASQAASGSGGSARGRGGARASTAAAVGAIGAAAGLAPGASKNNTTAKSQPAQTDVYNTVDPSGKVRSRKKVGTRLVGNTFEDAFREARKSGKSKFKYGKDGKEFTTQLASEQTDLFDIILEYLVAEGYADTNESAITIMTNMSEEWRESIVEKTIVSVEGGGKRKYTQSKGDMKADAQSAKQKSDAVQHGRKRKSEMDAGRLTVATKRGIEKATNRSERTTGYIPNSNTQPHERDDSFLNRNARRRRASGR